MSYKAKLRGRRAIITGATGFIGNAVLKSLLNAGVDVTAVLRSRHGAAQIRKVGAQVLTSGLADEAALKDAMSGADYLFNFAYDVRSSGKDNLAAFDALTRAAKSGQVGRIIHASSIVVYDDWTKADLTEKSPISTHSGGSYRQAKITMEQRLENLGLSCAILQPTIVYGPGSTLWSERIMGQLRTGPVVLPSTNGVCNAVFVDDVAQAAMKAATAQDIDCERFIVSGQPTDWHSFYDAHRTLVPSGEIKFEPLDALRERLGPQAENTGQGTGPSIAAKVSAQLRSMIGRQTFEAGVSLAKRFTHRGRPHYPDHFTLNLLTAEGICLTENARKLLNYHPKIGLSEFSNGAWKDQK